MPAEQLLPTSRLIDLNKGQIQIDGVDTAKVGLDSLRGALAIIPQDPVLFSGSVRMNLDPWKLQTDRHLWEVKVERIQRPRSNNHFVDNQSILFAHGQVLSMVQLKSVVQKLGGLDVEATNCGEELSTGERQLMCLAR